jgi:hypothetical protein
MGPFMIIEEQIKEAFTENLPYKPYCTDTKDFLRILPKALAIGKKYIQFNNPNSVKWLTFDCDYAGALEHIGNNQLPAPTIATVNKQNGKSHLFYGLETPVCITENGRNKPKQFLKAINYELTEKLNADQGYQQFISKNPLNDVLWDSFIVNPVLWELNDFLEYLTLPKTLPKKANYIGIGRNCTTFDHTRKWAYGQVLSYRLCSNQETFHKAVLAYCEEFNQANFPTNPLHSAEISAIAKSVAKWTWNKYTGRMSDEKFSQIQAIRGSKGGLTGGKGRTTQDQENRLKARSMRSEGYSQTHISILMGYNKSTISRWLK